MDRVYKKYNIHNARTKVRNPQANGKMERWWFAVEKRTKPLDNLDDIYEQIRKLTQIYNYKLVHRCLPRLPSGLPRLSSRNFS